MLLHYFYFLALEYQNLAHVQFFRFVFLCVELIILKATVILNTQID